MRDASAAIEWLMEAPRACVRFAMPAITIHGRLAHRRTSRPTASLMR